ncbi:HugZ family protein [Aureimonas sp. ME7]|uniref:HugZ family pyridoxamine 5'-phosphate oxidase n=1 Tax=Aureimonas sp. ME7 TaxID=2744252 RepID=UPI0015F64D38|nr:HugZ family protein [Aureimonas sp. ME7]
MADTGSPPTSPHLPPDDQARALARRLVRGVGHAVLGCLDPDDGFPLAARVLLGTDLDGAPILLLSQLSAHTRAIATDNRLSLLVGEPGDGDPLRQPRLALQGRAWTIDTKDEAYERISRRFLTRHPSASLYVGFADFAFLRVEIAAGLLNAGFARAYRMGPEDLRRDMPVEILQEEEALRCFAETALTGAASDAAPIRVVSIDAEGLNLERDGAIERVDFSTPVSTRAQFEVAIREIKARSQA